MQAGPGAPRKARNWKDAQLIISSLSLALTLGLWGLWSSHDKGMASIQGESEPLPAPEPMLVEVAPMLLPGQTLYLMTPAPETTATVAEQQQPRRRNKDKGGGGGGGGTPRPVHPSLMEQLKFRAMGSRMLAILDLKHPVPLLDDVPIWFEEWEQALSRFRIDSELMRLNAAAGSPVSISQTLWDVLQAALDAERWSHGLVNPLILEDLVQAGYDRPFEQLGGNSSLDPMRLTHEAYWRTRQTLELSALSSVIVNDAARTVCLLPGTGLDFGGVAKGWAAHQAVKRLAATAPALVSAGGDVAVSGPRADGEPWRITVEDPFRDDGYLEMLYIEAGGVATSGKDHRHWQRGGLFQHHIIDPRTRQPAVTDILAATVVASNVMRAEALAKAVLISGSRAGFELLDEHADAEGMLVLDNGTMLYSAQFEKYL